MSEHIQATQKEMLEGYSRMSPEQMELSAARELFLGDERIKELPVDLQYLPESHSWATGQFRGEISGTFGGRRIDLKKTSWDGETFCYSGNADGDDLTTDDARKLYDKIYPTVKQFDKMQKYLRKISRRIADEEHKSSLAEASKLQRTEESGYMRGVKEGEIRGLLTERLKDIELDKEDTAFLQDVITRLTQLLTKDDPRGSGSFRVMKRVDTKAFDDSETARQKKETQDQYNRLIGPLYAVLGVDPSQPQEWGAGFGVTYLHSRVYDTIFPEIVVRECYDWHELRLPDNVNGAQITIEKNSLYQHPDQERQR